MENRKLEVKWKYTFGEKKRLVTPLMRTIVSDSFAVLMIKSVFLPPLPPVPPEGATLPRGKWLWHPIT